VSGMGGNVLLIRMLQYARRTLLLAGATAYGASLGIILSHTGGHATAQPQLVIFWAALTVVSLAATGMLAVARVLPRPYAGHLDRLPEIVEATVRRAVWRRRRVLLRGLKTEVVADNPIDVAALKSRLDRTCVGVSLRPRPWWLWQRLPRVRHVPWKQLVRHPRDREAWHSLVFGRQPSLGIRPYYHARPLLAADVARGVTELALESDTIEPAPRSEKSVHTQRGPSEALSNTIIALRDAIGPTATITVTWSDMEPANESDLKWQALAAECAAGRLRAGTSYRLTV
jgi:hypothetical protein